MDKQREEYETALNWLKENAKQMNFIPPLLPVLIESYVERVRSDAGELFKNKNHVQSAYYDLRNRIEKAPIVHLVSMVESDKGRFYTNREDVPKYFSYGWKFQEARIWTY